MWTVPDSYCNINASQRFFIQQWGIETLDNAPISRISSRSSSVELFDELLDVIELVDKGRISRADLSDLIHELEEHFTENELLRIVFSRDVEAFRDILQHNKAVEQQESRKQLALAASVFLKTLRSTNLADKYVEKLSDRLQSNPSFTFVRQAARTLITELLSEGNSMQYLHRWGSGVFLYDKEPDFSSRFSRIAESLGKKGERQFSCVVKLTLPSDPSEILHPYPLVDHTVLGPLKTSQSLMDFFSATDMGFLLVGIQAADRPAAAEQAHRIVENRTRLWRFSNPNYVPGISRTVLVLEESRNDGELVSNVNTFRSLKVSNLPLFFQLSGSRGVNRSTEEVIARAIHWATLANDSAAETRLLALWAALESTLAGFCNTNSVQLAQDNLVSILGLNHIRQRLFHLWFGLQNSLKAARPNLYERIVRECVAPGQASRIHEAVLWEELVEGTQTLFNVLPAGDEWLKAEIDWFSKSRDGAARYLHRYLTHCDRQIKSTTRQIYRLRNLLAHQAVVAPLGLEMMNRILSFYVAEVLNSLVFALHRNPSCSVEEILFAYRETYRSIEDYLRTGNLSELDYNRTCKPRLLLCS